MSAADLGEALAALLPPGFSCSLVPVDDHSAELKDEERRASLRFAPRRLRTFSSGRVAARRALGADVPIAVLPGGAPAAPEGLRLSISHTDDFALAVACRSAAAEGVGVDIEEVARMDLAYRRLVVGPLDRVPEDDPLKLTATFSLREALFKALQGRVREGGFVRWDGDAVEIGVEGRALGLRWGWRSVGGYVLSVCVALP